jgi:hypothetical protein
MSLVFLQIFFFLKFIGLVALMAVTVGREAAAVGVKGLPTQYVCLV